jgi:hypothetical protein
MRALIIPDKMIGNGVSIRHWYESCLSSFRVLVAASIDDSGYLYLRPRFSPGGVE